MRRFFSSYNRGETGWSYLMGSFAQQSLPLTDSVTLRIQRVNSTRVESVTVRFRLLSVLVVLVGC